MAITKREVQAEEMKTIKAIYVASKDGKKTKIDLSNLSKIVDATLTNKGLVQLQTTIDNSETTAATPKAVNTVKTAVDANTQKIKEIEDSINNAAPGDGSLADKLKNVAFVNKANEFSESQTIVSKDSAGTDTATLIIKGAKADAATGAMDPGTTAVKTGVQVTDKNNKQLAGFDAVLNGSGRDASLNVYGADGQAHGVRVHMSADGTGTATAFAPDTPDSANAQEIATAKFVNDRFSKVSEFLTPGTAEKTGVVKLSDEVDETKDAASGATAATPKALHSVDAKVGKLSAVIGVDAEHAALKNAENTFTEAQTLAAKSSGSDEVSQLNFKAEQYKHLDGTFADGITTKFKANSTVTDNTGSKIAQTIVHADATNSQIGIEVYNADNSQTGSVAVKYDRDAGTFVATAPSTNEDASSNEIATADFVKKKVTAVQDNLVDASDSQRGLTLLSDAVNEDKGAADGKTAATPKAVKTVNDALTAVTSVVGANAEHAALKNAENTFAESQTFAKDLIQTSADAKHLVKASFAKGDEHEAAVSANFGLVDSANAGTDSSAIGGVKVEYAADKSVKAAVYAHAGNVAGDTGDKIEIGYTADGKVYTHAPTPVFATAGDTEIATVKTVKDAVGDLDASHVAYTNKTNHFEAKQEIDSGVIIHAQKQSTTDEASAVVKSGIYDHASATFTDGEVTSGKVENSVKDSNNLTIASNVTEYAASGVTVSQNVHGTDGAVKASIELKYNRDGDTVVATAPDTPAGATAQEIATAKFVTDADKVISDKLQAVTDVVGEAAENVALKNASNTFTQPQKISTDDKILNLGGDGLASEGSADDALVLGASFDGSHAEIIIAANGSITRTDLPADPDDLEIATVGYVKSLGDIGSSLNTGNWSIALKDYTDEANHADMQEGVFYSVPFNAQDQYIKIDPETGKPAETQAPGVDDKVVDHFKIRYMAPSSKIVMDLGERKIAPDFEDVPLLSKDNAFTGTNTFKDAQKATPSTDTSLSDVSDKSFIAKSEFINYFNKNSPWNNVVTVEPKPENMVPGQIYFLIEE